MGPATNWQDAVSGSVAGAVAKTATAPLERVKMVSPRSIEGYRWLSAVE